MLRVIDADVTNIRQLYNPINPTYNQPMLKKFVFALLLICAVKAQYNETLAKYLAQLCLASYCRPALIQSWTCLPCKKALKMSFPSVLKNSTNDTLGYIAISDQLDATVLVLRGTLPWDIKNWFVDINFLKKSYKYCNNSCEVHRGFYEAYEDIENHVRSSVDNYTATFKKRNLIITGHSLGAALSTHAAAHLIATGHKVDHFYNFGGPRVGDWRFHLWFTAAYNGFVGRVTHWKDQVPHLPDMYWGFEHLHNEVWYTLDQSYFRVCNDSGEDKTCSNQYPVTNWLDHLNYVGINFNDALLCQD